MDKPLYDYESLLKPIRRRQSLETRSSNIEEYSSDRSRIVYSSSFRRLQQKAQVFSLESNSFVRTRLTHSIEVADVGRLLAQRITEKLVNDGYISTATQQEMLIIVENACYLHDIGNPPFGHFGEAAIQRWARDNLGMCATKACVNCEPIKDKLEDFYNFDGNPQGFRMVTRLHCENGDTFGLNISYPTLLSSIKYTRATGESVSANAKNKASYFQSEKKIVEDMYTAIGLTTGTRYPLSYIMEAADDISYCLSDISDGIEKKILRPEDVVSDIYEEWSRKFTPTRRNSKTAYIFISNELELPKGEIHYYNREVAIRISKFAISEATKEYFAEHERIFRGTCPRLIDDASKAGCLLSSIKTIARKKLYRSAEAENIELAGYRVIMGLLECYGRLLVLTQEDFTMLLNGTPPKERLDYEFRLLNRISRRLKTAYRNQLHEQGGTREIEWWLRIHLVIDYISGMTDEYALKVYQLLQGISTEI